MSRLKVEVWANVLYTCTLSEEDSEKVRNYALESDCELTTAVDDLYSSSQIELYKNSVESDFSTDYTSSVEEEEDE